MATLHSPICGTVCTCSSHRTLSLTTLIKLPSLFPDHEIKIRNENMVLEKVDSWKYVCYSVCMCIPKGPPEDGNSGSNDLRLGMELPIPLQLIVTLERPIQNCAVPTHGLLHAIMNIWPAIY